MEIGSFSGAAPPTGGNHIQQRYTKEITQALEGLYKEGTHPDAETRKKLGRELGLSPHQIRRWFQNKRNKKKAGQVRAEISALKAANEELRRENRELKEELKNVMCTTCGNPVFYMGPGSSSNETAEPFQVSPPMNNTPDVHQLPDVGDLGDLYLDFFG